MGIDSLLNIIRAEKRGLSRVDLNQCYNFAEYNEAVKYGKKNMEVAGVRDLLTGLSNESQKYKSDIAAIAAAKREEEERKYLLWSKWYKPKQICLWVMIGFIVLWVIASVARYIGKIPEEMSNMLFLFNSLTRTVILVFVVLKAGEAICRKKYDSYAREVLKEIEYRNIRFANTAREYYEKVDSLYLNSLDPAHREMVLMHREQTEHNNEMLRMEQERVRKEDERLAEQRRARKAQEELLAIEKEREKRYGH